MRHIVLYESAQLSAESLGPSSQPLRAHPQICRVVYVLMLVLWIKTTVIDAIPLGLLEGRPIGELYHFRFDIHTFHQSTNLEGDPLSIRSAP